MNMKDDEAFLAASEAIKRQLLDGTPASREDVAIWYARIMKNFEMWHGQISDAQNRAMIDLLGEGRW